MKIRTTKPEAGNKFFIRKANGGYSTCIQGSPTDKDCNVLANCVGYACGRFNEIVGTMKYPSLNCNAENFIERAQNTYGLKVGQEPKPGAIMCWQHGTLSSGDGAGHVAVVEKVISPTEVYTSESSWSGTAFFNATRKKGNGKWGINAYTFRGFIYNPAVPDEPPITPNVEKDTTKDQLEVKVTALRVRKDAGLNASILGFAHIGYYNYYEHKSLDGYEWYRIADNNWIATTPEWVSIYPKAEPPKPEFKVGDKVVPITLVNWKGTRLKQYDKEYTIMQIDSRGAVLGAPRKGKLQVWAVLKLDNIKKVN